MAELLRIAAGITTPLALASVIVIVLYSLYKAVVHKLDLRALRASQTFRVVDRLLFYLFVLAVIGVVLAVTSFTILKIRERKEAQVGLVDVTIDRELDGGAVLGVKVRNVGETVAFIKRVDVRVTNFWKLYTEAPLAAVAPSGSYDLVIPVDSKGKTFTKKVEQEVSANRVDYFRVNTLVSCPAYGAVRNTAICIAALKISVVYNEDNRRTSESHEVLVDGSEIKASAGNYELDFSEGPNARIVADLTRVTALKTDRLTELLSRAATRDSTSRNELLAQDFRRVVRKAQHELAAFTWRHIATPIKSDLNVVATFDDGKVIVAGEKGAVWLSRDRGKVWTDISLPTEDHVLDISAPSDDRVWLVAKGGLWHGDGASDRWVRSNIDVAAEGVFFYDDRYGWLVGGNGAVAQTIDGGRSWTRNSIATGPNLWRVHFVTRRVGIAGGGDGQTWLTADGGSTWQKGGRCGTGVARIKMLNRTDAWAAGIDKACRTFDGGRTWRDVPLNIEYDLPIFISFGSDTEPPRLDLRPWGVDFEGELGCFVGGDGKPAAAMTGDGGATWVVRNIFPPLTKSSAYFLQAVAFASDDRIWAVGAGGFVAMAELVGVDLREFAEIDTIAAADVAEVKRRIVAIGDQEAFPQELRAPFLNELDAIRRKLPEQKSEPGGVRSST